MRLKWAIIPAAGGGSRLRPLTDAVPKALLPVGLKPMLLWSIEEAAASGVETVVIVCSPAQPSIAAYVEALARRGGIGDTSLRIVRQPQPAGIGDAIGRCRELTGDHPFGVLVPDNWFVGETPALATVAACHARTGLDAFGLVAVEPDEAALFGNVGGVELKPLTATDFRVLTLADKRQGAFVVAGDRPVLRGVARYVVTPRFYAALDATGPPAVGEWDDVPAFQHLIGTTGLAATPLDARFFDVGQAPGYLAAMRYCAGATDSRIPPMTTP